MRRLRRRHGKRGHVRTRLGWVRAPRYVLDGDAETTMAELMAGNSDAPLPREYVRAMQALNIGEKYDMDFGAGGVTEVRRIS